MPRHYLQKPVDADELLAAFARGEDPPADEVPEEPAAPSLARAEWEHIQRVLTDCRRQHLRGRAPARASTAASLQRKLQKYPPRR